MNPVFLLAYIIKSKMRGDEEKMWAPGWNEAQRVYSNSHKRMYFR